MPRVLGGTHILIIQDQLSNSEIHLKYRMPTSKEIISYRNGGMKRKRNKVIDRIGENRIEHGLKILVGFRDGDFLKEDGTPLSVENDSNWKDLVKEQASDLIETLAFQVFDGSSQVIHPEDEDEPEEGEDAEGN